MKRILILSVMCLALIAVAAPALAVSFPAQPPWWTGYNAALKDYYVQPGYPAYDPHARYIGDLKGTWEEMGIQYGERAGDLIRMVFDGYYDQIFASVKDANRIVAEARNFAAWYGKAIPEAYQFMQGIAKGASSELKKSIYANIGNDFDKIVIINHYFALRKVNGHQYLGGGKIASAGVEFDQEENPACTGVVVIGAIDGPTKDRTTIHGGTRDQVFFPQCYEVAYTLSPSDPKAHRIWTIASAGELGGQMVGNDLGVIVTGYAGGDTKSIWAYGIEWNIGDWYGALFGGSAEEAANILTVGRPGYFEKTGEKVFTAAWGINWLISDKTDARCVEIVPGRYAIRKIGDLGEDKFLICTNHCMASWSYDYTNTRTTVPMTDYGPIAGAYSGLSVSGTRFYTMWWNVKYNYGKIDRAMVMSWYAGRYYIDQNGVRVDTIWDTTTGQWIPAANKATSPARHQAGWPDTMKGTTVDAKVGVAQDLAFYWTKGRGDDWVGPWDVLTLKYNYE